MTTLRNPTLDIAKGLGIVLVVLGHNPNLAPHDGAVWRAIFSFHMPLFFVLSGVFLRADTAWATFARARFHSLLKPYFVVMGAVWLASAGSSFVSSFVSSLVSSSVSSVSSASTQVALLSPAMRALGVAYGTGTSLAWEPAWTTLWFLPHLFVASAITLALIKAVNGRARAALWLAGVAVASVSLGGLSLDTFAYTDPVNWSLTGTAHLPGLPWSLDLAPISVAYLLGGYLLGGYLCGPVLRKLRLTPAVWMIFFAAALTFAALHAFSNVHIDLNLRVYGPGLAATVQAALGIGVTLLLAGAIDRAIDRASEHGIAPRIDRGMALPCMQTVARGLARVLAYIGSGTLFLLLFHSFVQGKGLSGLARHWGNLPYPTLGVGAISLLAALALPLLAWEVCKRVPLLRRWLLP